MWDGLVNSKPYNSAVGSGRLDFRWNKCRLSTLDASGQQKQMPLRGHKASPRVSNSIETHDVHSGFLACAKMHFVVKH